MRPSPRSLFVVALLAWALVLPGCADEGVGPVAAGGQSANGGCALPSLTCGGVCRDLATDRANCGACGRACGANQVCSRGACGGLCSPDLTACAVDGSCRDLRSDPAHCGACGRACGEGEVCSRGACAAACAPGLAACGSGACRDLMTDPFHCGACGRVCLAGEACTSGACALPSVCALGTAANTAAEVDRAQLASSAPAAVTIGAVGQTFAVGRAGFLSGVEVSLATCGGALTAGSTVQLAVRDELGQTLATAAVGAGAVGNGACPRVPPALGAAARGTAVFDLGAACVPVAPGRTLTFTLTAAGATTNGTCPAGPAGTRRCSNAPTVACTAAAQCAGRPAIVRAGAELVAAAGLPMLVGGAAVAGATLAYKTFVTPYVLQCGGATSCAGACRDLTSDRRNCGACGRTCSAAQVCSAGRCAAACGAGLVTCGSGASAYCANPASDNLNCGACGAACAPGQVCAAGACVTTCGAGATTCGRGSTAYCANTATDNANCGECGRACAAGQVCSGGVCGLTCGGATTPCGGACVDPRYDPAHCGGCGRACPGGRVCAGGACVPACDAACGVGAQARCVDAGNDPANCGGCGVRCPAGQVCAAGACGVSCGAGSTACGSGEARYCARTGSDGQNCGGCGVACSAGSACVAGACAVTCAPGQTACGGGCADLAHDEANCGACGAACAAGQRCTMGACAAACRSTDATCAAECVDPQRDADHCGACGARCPRVGAHALRACAEATCGAVCVAGWGDCDASRGNGCEADLRTDAQSCGRCGRACSFAHAGGGCVAGACAIGACDAGWVDCDGDASNGCELEVGGACAPPGQCGTGRVGCFEGQAACYLEVLFAAGTACRPSQGVCDVGEVCDGVSPQCPVDRVTDGTECPGELRGGGTANQPGECLARYTFRVEAGRSYTISTCDEFTGDPVLRVTGACACANDDACGLGPRCTCTATEDGEAEICASSYQFTAATWSYSVTTPGGRCGAPRTCRAAATPCDAAEACDGLNPACPADARRPEGGACDDGDLCTRGDTCRAGMCSAGAAVTCTEGQCQGAFCDRATGACVAKSDGTACDDGDGATAGDACYAGACRGYGERPAEVAAGGRFSLVRGFDGRVWSFGANLLRVPGDGAPEALRVPTPVPGLAGMSAVSAGLGHALALGGDGVVRAWGANDRGQLGDGTTAARATVAAVAGVPPMVRVAAGGAFSVGLTLDGSVWTWGANDRGQLARGATAGDAPTPGLVAPFAASRVISIAAGDAHALALTGDGAVWAWGSNEHGELGQGDAAPTSGPRPVPGLSNVTAVAAGRGFSVALTLLGEVWAWGDDAVGQLGDGGATARFTPQRVPGLPVMSGISAGAAHCLAQTSTGELWGWGETASGRLAIRLDGPDVAMPPPRTATRNVSLIGLRGFAAGLDHSLAVTADYRLWSYGGNERGQLGDDRVAPSRHGVAPVVGFGRYAVNVLTQRNDTLRTGANLRETALTVANVNQRTFGRLFDVPVQGDVLAQPLYVHGAVGGRDAVYVATLDNYVYAFDAETGAVFWSRQVGQPMRRDRYYWCEDLRGNVGIVSTPVIDLSRGTMYFVAKRVPDAMPGAPEPMPVLDLHAVDLVTGEERPASPVRVAASVAGDAHIATRTDVVPPAVTPAASPWFADPRASTGNTAGRVVFDATYQMQRPALLLQDGQVHVTFGGHCDLVPYHGWLISYDAGTLAQTGAMVTTPTGSPSPTQNCGTVRWDNVPTLPGPATGGLNGGIVDGYGQGGGVWQYGNGPSSTGSGDLYLAMGNSMGVVDPMDLMASFAGGPASSSTSFSNAVLRVGRRGDGSLGVQSWFQPGDYAARDVVDDDLGSAGPMLIPGSDRLLVGGKRGALYLLRRSALGGFSATNAGAVSTYAPTGNAAVGNLFGGTTWWASPAGARFYLWTGGNNLRAFTIAGDAIVPAGEDPSGSFGVDRSTLSVSADASRAGTGVLWAFAPSCAGGTGLLAYDAENIAAGPIYSSALVTADQLPTPDASVSVRRSPVITVAAGRAYVGTLANRVVVYGLLPAPRPAISTPPASACTSTCPPSAGASMGPTPTWNDLYTDYFGPNTEGHCQNCHAHVHPGFGSSAASLYTGFVAWGLINTATPSDSRIIDPSRSRLRWVNPTGGSMPQDTPRPPLLCNAAAVDALNRWVAAGAPPPPPNP